MIDYFLKYTDEAAAKADAKVLADLAGKEKLDDEWYLDHTLPDVKAWRISQDVYSGSPPVFVRHTYLTGYFVLVALKGRSNILRDAPALQFALDRDAANAGKGCVIKNNIGTVIQDIGVEPTFAGSNYPMGGLSAPDSPPVV